MPAPVSKPGSLPVVVIGALTGGLLSSSCCLLQLLLNYTSVGCAGFSVLTPYRSYFRLLTGSLMAYLLYSQGLNRRTITTLLLSTALMSSQGLLSAHNKGQLRGSLQQVLARLNRGSGSAAGEPGLQQQQQQPQPQVAASRTLLHVTGMRCEACAARLRGNLEAVGGVDGCTVEFSEGRVEVWSNSSSQLVQPGALQAAVKATSEAYTVRVVSWQCFDAQEEVVGCPGSDTSGGVAGGSSSSSSSSSQAGEL